MTEKYFSTSWLQPQWCRRNERHVAECHQALKLATFTGANAVQTTVGWQLCWRLNGSNKIN